MQNPKHRPPKGRVPAKTNPQHKRTAQEMSVQVLLLTSEHRVSSAALHNTPGAWTLDPQSGVVPSHSPVVSPVTCLPKVHSRSSQQLRKSCCCFCCDLLLYPKTLENFQPSEAGNRCLWFWVIRNRSSASYSSSQSPCSPKTRHILGLT